MPNWCSNSIYVTGNKAEIEALAEAARAGGFCAHIKPCPAALTETVSGFLGDGEEQARLEEQQARNIEVYGYKTWYDFCVAEWGTKWDVGGDDAYVEVGEDQSGKWVLNFSFDSAWSPPTAIYQALLERGFEVDAFYYEPGMNFCGRFNRDADEYYEITGNSDWVSENIPEDIDVAMGITEQMASWEEEPE